MFCSDMQGSDNPVPLLRKLLLPKPRDNKEPHFITHHGNHPDVVKASGNGEDLKDSGKKRDVYRPSSFDAETGRHDHWLDDERETGSVIRRDRWREGDKELGDTSRMECWTDNSAKHSGEVRCAPSERWVDLGNRESNHDQRRESKWNTCWGPDDKGSENWHEKWSDSSKDGEGSRDKGTPHLTSHWRDISSYEKDADGEGQNYSRSWRSGSYLSRGRGETSYHQPPPPNKQTPMFAFGRGRGGNGGSVFSAGRGRVNSSMSAVGSSASSSHPYGTSSDKANGPHGNASTLKYTRMKLLDIYRMTDIKNHSMSLEGFTLVPSLTLADPLEPLSFSAPSAEELVILKGIDKGDIVSSGLPLVSKDGSTGRNSLDSIQFKRSKIGGREDLQLVMDDYEDESTKKIKDSHFVHLECPSYEKYSLQVGLDPKEHTNQNLQPYQENRLQVEGTHKKEDEVVLGEASKVESSPSHYTIPWKSQSFKENPSDVLKDFSAKIKSRTFDMGWSQLQNELETKQKKFTDVSSSYCRDESQQQSNEDLHLDLKRVPMIKRQLSEILDMNKECDVLHGQENAFVSKDKLVAGKCQPYASPEDLHLYYKDPQCQIQGPFSGSDLIAWFEAGYFGIDLQVRLVNAPPDAPFSLLGDVMPHLRMKSRPPPGFGAAKQSDVVEVSSRGKFGSSSNVHTGIGEFELIKNGYMNRQNTATEAENRFLESLISGRQGYGGVNSVNMPLVGSESNVDYLLAQKMALEQQRSLPNLLPYWAGRDFSSIVSKTDMIKEFPEPHSKLLPPMGDSSHLIPQSTQHVDLLSMLQAAADKLPSPSVNPGLPVWSNFPVVQSLNRNNHGGMDIIQDKIDMHHNQLLNPQTGFGAQQQSLQQQNQHSLSHIFSQLSDLPSGSVLPEKLLSSEISQDPQIMSLLQQNHLLSQFQLHSQALPSQRSPLDKILLLRQQQKQEQQQQQLLRQQQLLSQILPGQQSHQNRGDTSYGHLKSASPMENALNASMQTSNAPVDHLGFHQLHDVHQISQHVTRLNWLDERSSGLPNLSQPGIQDSSYTVSQNFPHQTFDQTTHLKDGGLSHDADNISRADPVATLAMTDNSFSSEAMEKAAKGAFVPRQNVQDLDNCAEQHPPAVSQTSETMRSFALESNNNLDLPKDKQGTSDFISSISLRVNDMNISSESILEQCENELPSAKEEKNVEVQEVKKASEKKPRKQKNSKTKTQSISDYGKGSSKTSSNWQSNKISEIKGASTGDSSSVVQREAEESLNGTSPPRIGGKMSEISAEEPLVSQQSELSMNISTNKTVNIEVKAEQGETETLPLYSQTTSSNQAWQAALGIKAKSLIEIQQEEQHWAQTITKISGPAAMVNPTNISPSPWAGIVANSKQKTTRSIVQGATTTQLVLDNTEDTSKLKNNKSQLHDLLAEEVLAKSNEGDASVPASDGKGLSSLPSQVGAQVDISAVNDDDFIEAKDTRRSRKKALKAKGAGINKSLPVSSVDPSASPIPIEKGRSTRQTQQEKEFLPVPPAGPSLADFVPWKGDQANSVPSPAWSTDLAKTQKPTSLRDIQREQEMKAASVQHQIPIPDPSKVQSSRNDRGSDSSWSVPGSSPSKFVSSIQTKAASPKQVNRTTSAYSKSKIEDDLFWGPVEQSKQGNKHWGTKNIPVKGASGVASIHQKPSSSINAEYALSPSPSTGRLLSKGKDASKHSEAMDFRDWCESELGRLTGSKDTNFLEFCLKQSTSEAELLLIENLGSLDRNHEFIDKFLNYKEFLSSDVLEIAFQARTNVGVTGDSPGRSGSGAATTRDTDANMDTGLDESAKGGQKRRKKGKKASPSVLGFNVVSNRIMMGEIQTVDD